MQINDMLIGGMDIVGIYCVDLTPTIGKQVKNKNDKLKRVYILIKFLFFIDFN